MESNGSPAPSLNDSPEFQPLSCIERALPVTRASCLPFDQKENGVHKRLCRRVGSDRSLTRPRVDTRKAERVTSKQLVTVTLSPSFLSSVFSKLPLHRVSSSISPKCDLPTAKFMLSARASIGAVGRILTLWTHPQSKCHSFFSCHPSNGSSTHSHYRTSRSSWWRSHGGAACQRALR
jgi:hypothetical protein